MELDNRQRAMLQEMGVTVWQPLPVSPAAVGASVPVAAARPTPAIGVAAMSAAQVPAGVADAGAAPGAAALLAQSGADWAALAEAAQACQACGLCASRKFSTLRAPHGTPAGSDPGCDWLVLGDPPQEEEDRSGLPFAGADGVLLDNMLRALGLLRVNGESASAAQTPGWQDPARRVYVSNVVKCRPAHGQIPQATDLAQCGAYLQREIALVRPRVILSLGRFANQLLLAHLPALAEQPLGKLRGAVHHYQGIPVVVSYHPQALMRNGFDKGKAWLDLCLAADTVAVAAPRMAPAV